MRHPGMMKETLRSHAHKRTPTLPRSFVVFASILPSFWRLASVLHLASFLARGLALDLGLVLAHGLALALGGLVFLASVLLPLVSLLLLPLDFARGRALAVAPPAGLVVCLLHACLP